MAEQERSEMNELVADITDRSLLQGSFQRKAAFEKGQQVIAARDHINYSFGSSPTKNYALGAYFRQTGIGVFDDLSPSLKTEYDKCKYIADNIPTPSLSSCISEQVGDYSDEKECKENCERRSSLDSETHKNKRESREQIPKPKNYLNIYYFILKFKSLLLQLVKSRTIFSLNRHQFELINDRSFCDSLLKKRQTKLSKYQKLNNLTELTWKFIQQLPILDPSHPFAISMELLSFFFITTQIFYLPVRTSYQITLSTDYLILLFQYLPLVYFSFEILLSFNKGYYQEGVVVIDRSSVTKHYLKSDFFIHLITTFSLYFHSLPISNISTFLFLCRIPQLMTIVESIDDHFRLQQRIPIGFQLISLLFQIFLVAHLYGCGFHFVGNNSNPEMNWILQKNLDDNSPVEVYVCSIYFAIIAMITVGFGDIVPANTYERIYVILMTCFSCGIFAFAINTIGNIVKEKQQFSHELKINKNAILSYMIDRSVSTQNQNKVIRYLEFSHRNPDDRWSKGREIMQNMSKRVREEFYKEFYSRVLHSIPFFQGRFSKQFYDEIQTHLQEAVFVPGECITQHDKISTHLYYIVTGEVQQMIPSCQTHIAILKPGDSFDEESFVGQLPCKYEYVCKTVTQIVALSYEKLTEILESFKVDYEVFKMQVQEANLGGQINHTKECISCKSKAHNVISCPLCHYEVNYDLFIKRYVSSQPQKRENIERNRKFKMTVSTEIMRKQLRNLRLKLPKNYCYRSQSDRQNIFLSETLFDMNQLSECDDAGFMIITPRIAYNPLVDDIEMILEDEEGEFEGGFFADEDILGKSLEQSFDDLTMMTHEFLGQVESGKREGRRNGLVLQKNEPATPLFPQENTKSSSEKEIKNQSQQDLQDINNNITNYIPAGTNSRPSWFLNEEEDSLLANKGIDQQINSNNHSQTLTSQLKNVTIKQTNSNTNFNQSQYSSGFTKKSLMQTIQSKGLTSDSIDTSLGNEQQQQYVPVMIKSDKVPLPHLYGTEQRNQNIFLGTNSQISFKNRPKQSQLKRKSQSLILLNNEVDPIQPQSQRDSMQSQSESSLVFTEKKVTKMIEKQCESHSELLINDTNYTSANKKQQKQSEQEKESLQSNKNANDKSQCNKIAVTNSEQTKIILMQQQQLHQLQQQLKNCRMSYKNQGFKTSQLGNSNGTKLAAVAAVASMQSKHPNNIHKFPLKQHIQQINGQQAQMVENPYSSTSNLALSLSSSGNSNNNNGVAFLNQFSPQTNTNYGNYQQFFQQQQPGLFRQSPQFIVKSGSSDVNGSRSSNFLGSANNLGGVGGNQLGAYPAPKAQRISINLNEPSNTSVSSSNIKEFSNKTRLSSSSVASPGHMPLSQIQQSPHFFNNQIFQYQIGQQQLQQQQQQAGTQLLPQQQQQQQLQQQNGGSILSNTGTVSGKKQTFSGVSGVYNRISSMLGTGTIVKAQNKRQPEDQYKNIPIEMTTEEPLKEEIYQFMLDRFDQMKIFQCFFPHNNFDMVLSELKGKLKTAKSTPHRRGPKRIRKHNNRGSGNQGKDINSRYTTSQMASPALTALI